jgi:hypothetical protein
MLNTMAGKQWLAEFMADKGIIKTPEEIIMVMTTGNSEPMYEGQQSELMLIKQENEDMGEGICPPVLLTDNVLLHLKEHATVGNSSEARKNPQVMKAYTDHMQLHLANWKGGLDPTTGQMLPPMDPDLANLLGIPMPPMPLMPGMPAPGLPPAPGQEMPNEMPGQNIGAPEAEPGAMKGPPKTPKASAPPPGTPAKNQSPQPGAPM